MKQKGIEEEEKPAEDIWERCHPCTALRVHPKGEEAISLLLLSFSHRFWVWSRTKSWCMLLYKKLVSTFQKI